MEVITARMVLSCPAENIRRAVERRNIELVRVRVIEDDVAGPCPRTALSECDVRASRCAVNDKKSWKNVECRRREARKEVGTPIS
jgi:hypothetical protein